jgi:serine/threonine protein kinase
MIAEARLVFQLTHANICQVLDLAVGVQGTFIIMEYVDGCDLRSLLGTMSVPAAVYITREVAKGLDYAHRRRDASGRALFLVHGDVTPQNILLSREGEVKLADFGIARTLSLGGHGPGNRLIAGTPGFCAPESKAGNVDQRSDIYSLGVCLHAALTGRVPGPDSDGHFDAHGIEGVGQDLVEIMARATASRREDRYASVAELEHALSLHLAHRYPSFTTAALAKQVTSHAAERSLAASEADHSLVSITGTATFLSAAPNFPDVVATAAESPAARGTFRVDRNAPSRSRMRIVLAACALIAVGGVIAWRTLAGRPHEVVSAPPPVVATAPPPIATASPPEAPQPPTPSSAPAPTVRSASAKPARPTKHPRHEVAARTEPPAAGETQMGFLTVYSEPWGIAYVDGRRFADTTPFFRAPLAAGNHRVTVFSPDRKAQSPAQSAIIHANENKTLIFKW